MADYPDWTDLIQIVGSDIMIPMDLQAAYIMMPIDIQAQYVNLEVDIVAQTVGNITVDIAAASMGNINVDINAQTIGNITIDIEAQSIGIQSKPLWEQGQGHGKVWTGTSSNTAVGGSITSNYTPGTGKTLYIISFGAWQYAYTDSDRDKPDRMAFEIASCIVGGDGGLHVNLDQPIIRAAGVQLTWVLYNYSYHAVNHGYWIKGFELG